MDQGVKGFIGSGLKGNVETKTRHCRLWKIMRFWMLGLTGGGPA